MSIPKDRPDHDTGEAVGFGHPTGGIAIPDDDRATTMALSRILAQSWNITGQLDPLATGSTARVWSVGDKIIKLARDDPDHFNAGLRASLAIQAGGIETGAPITTVNGELSQAVTINNKRWVMAVFRRINGVPTSMHTFTPTILGQLLAQIHVSLHPIESTGAWTVSDVLGHMRRGILTEQSVSTQRLILASVDAVQNWYSATHPLLQLIRGDGPEILSQDQKTIAAVIDWGGVRLGSIADDIGCWTVHGATDTIPIKEYTKLFMQSYKTIGEITPAEEMAIPLFQRLRVTSRLCYVTDRDMLAATERWMDDVSHY